MKWEAPGKKEPAASSALGSEHPFPQTAPLPRENNPPAPASRDSSTGPAPRIPDHTLIRRIGFGSYGEVWLARNVVGTLRAVKIVQRSRFERSEHFEREFRGLQKFEPISRAHQGLVDVLQIGRDDDAGYFYYVMELADDAAERRREEGGRKTEDGGQRTEGGGRRTEGGDRISDISGQWPVVDSPQEPESYAPGTLNVLLRERGRLPVEDCVRIGLSLASALAHLHRHRLVHRDVKPSNVIFVQGEPKLADAGLVASMDDARSVVGTVGYIPPEGQGTPPADLYSLGKVLYETAFGKDRREFPRVPAELREDPAYARLLELNAVILKACENDPRRRYASAAALSNDLEQLRQGQSVQRQHRWRERLRVGRKLAIPVALLAAGVAIFLIAPDPLGRQPKPGGAKTQTEENSVERNSATAQSQAGGPMRSMIRSIAVLPFTNDSPGAANAYLGPRLAEELTEALSKLPNLRVTRGDSAKALASATNRFELARELKIGALVTGRVRQKGAELQVSARMFDMADGSSRWTSGERRGKPKDLAGLRIVLVEELVAAMGLHLTETLRQRLIVKMPRDYEAYDLFQRGKFYMSRLTPDGFRLASDCFEKAVALDPEYAAAYAGLAACRFWGESTSPVSSRSTVLEARQRLAQKALALDPTLDLAHIVIARVKMNQWDWAGAEGSLRKTIELDPNSAWAHTSYGLLCLAFRRFDEALAARMRAESIDPLSAPFKVEVGDVHFFQHHYEESIRWYRRALALDPDFARAYRFLGRAYAVMGLTNESIAAARKAVELSGDSVVLASLGYAYGRAGRREEALNVLAELESRSKNSYVSPYLNAKVLAGLGQTDAMFDLLDQACEQHDRGVIALAFDLEFEPYRADPRFARVLKCLGLDAPLTANGRGNGTTAKTREANPTANQRE